MAEKTYGGDFIVGFLVGGLVGAAAALLLAPQSGEETRALIREKGIELQDRADEMTVDARRRAEELQVQAREKASAVSTQTKTKATEIQSKVMAAVEQGKTAATQQKEDLLPEINVQEMNDEAASEAPSEAQP